MSFGWIAAGVAVREYREGKKDAKAATKKAQKQAAEQIAAIEEQTEQIRRSAAQSQMSLAPPPPPAPISAPIRQAAGGTGSRVFSPGLLMSTARKKKRGATTSGSGMGYGSRL